MSQLLVLNTKKDREKLAKTLEASGVKVRSDSGGRALVVDIPSGTKDVEKKLPAGVRLTNTKEGAKALAKPDTNEKIFLDALELRTKPAFVAKLKKYKPGQSPEEKELLEAPHFFDEETDDWQ